jgi:hypothetical protein
MITIQSKNIHPRCEVWLSGHDMKAMTKLAYLYQELRIKRDENLQQDSDLDLQTLPIYACKVPSFLFYPFITYHCGTWFTSGPNFIIPTQPINRLHGKNWINNIALSPAHLVNPQFSESKYRLAWIEPDGSIKPENIYSHAEVIDLASAAQSYFLDEIRYVYDESKSVLDHSKSSKPSRYCFNENIADFESTKEYLTWYISIFNEFYNNLLKFGEQEDKEKRMQFLIAGWTINRLAVDSLTIASTDIPYIRKWQFFGFLDALGNLINQITTGKTGSKEDGQKVNELLSLQYFNDKIQPALTKIPVATIREEIITYTQSIYESIESMKTTFKTKDGESTMSGQDLLRAYRNSRHGYAITEYQRQALIAHSGKIPDNLPDLCIALCHYALLEFPF